MDRRLRRSADPPVGAASVRVVGNGRSTNVHRLMDGGSIPPSSTKYPLTRAIIEIEARAADNDEAGARMCGSTIQATTAR